MPGQPGVAPGPTPPSGPVTPLRQEQDAQAKAMELLNMEEGPRRVEMRNIESQNPNFYAVVKDQMDRQRRKGESAGRAQAGQM